MLCRPRHVVNFRLFLLKNKSEITKKRRKIVNKIAYKMVSQRDLFNIQIGKLPLLLARNSNCVNEKHKYEEQKRRLNETQSRNMLD